MCLEHVEVYTLITFILRAKAILYEPDKSNSLKTIVTCRNAK